VKKILPIFSYLFHPIFIPIFASIYYFYFNDSYFSYSNFDTYIILIQVLIITICIPITFFYLLRSLGKIDSIMVSELSQRKLPLFFQAILILVLIKKGATIDRVPELYFFFLAGFCSTIIALILIFCKIKASLHLLGMSSLLFFITGLSLHNQTNQINLICVLILITGFVASSRLEMKAHSVKELIVGFLIGGLPQVGFWWIWL
jgi:hypothetical protein